MSATGSTDSTAEKIAHKLGIPWPSAEEGQLRQAATAFDAAASALDAQREACTAKVGTVTAGNSGGGVEQFATFWGRYDGASGVMPATAQACRDTASALRQYADQVEQTKTSIRHKVEIAGAALVVGAVAAIFTFGASEAAAAAAAAAIAEMAAAAGVALSATVVDIIGVALVGAAFGAVESVAVDALVVQPLSVALGEQKGFDFGELVTSAEFGGAGGFLGGAAGGALGRLPALSEGALAGFPRLGATLDGLTTFSGTAPGRLLTGGLIGGGTVEALHGFDASGLDVLFGALGGMAGAGGRGRRPGEPEPEPEAAPIDPNVAGRRPGFDVDLGGLEPGTYEYVNPASGRAGAAEPSLFELLGVDKSAKYSPGSEEHMLAAYAKYLDRTPVDKQYSWERWRDLYIRNQGHAPRGAAFEEAFFDAFAFRADDGWQFRTPVEFNGVRRDFDAYNPTTARAYELKSGNSVSKAQLLKDAQIVEDGVDVCYVFGKEPTAATKQLLEEYGISYTVWHAEAVQPPAPVGP